MEPDIERRIEMGVSETTAVILAGGVAKGAFEAGALEVLAATDIQISQLVATSSGALNGSFLAAAIRAGKQRESAARLVTLWQDEADWMRSINFDLKDLLSGVALSDSRKLLQLMHAEIEPLAGAEVNRISLKVVVGLVNGTLGNIGKQPATTYERVLEFDEHSFEKPADRERIYQAVAASTAFPLVYAPVEIEGIGPCCDGGAVNDTPVRLAIGDGARRIFVIAPYPAIADPPKKLHGVDLLSHLVDVLIHERLYRDLHDAEQVNQSVRQIEEMVAQGRLSADQARQVLDVMGWKKVELIAIRPERELPGNAFSGLFHRDLRVSYVEAGRRAARAVISG
jgi:NTE family protein